MLEHCSAVVLGALQVEQCTYVRTYSHTTTHLLEQSHVEERAQGGHKKMNPQVGEDGRYEVIRVADEDGRRLSESTRYMVLRRDRCACVFCGRQGRLEVDHIIPWSAGGSDDMDNLRTLCHDCNQYRSNFRVLADDDRRLPTAHECVYCTPHLLGEPDVVSVYCMPCNKKAPGIPLNPKDSATLESAPSGDWPDDYDRERNELAAVAAKYRADALSTIRLALKPSGSFRAGRFVVLGLEVSNA